MRNFRDQDRVAWWRRTLAVVTLIGLIAVGCSSTGSPTPTTAGRSVAPTATVSPSGEPSSAAPGEPTSVASDQPHPSVAVSPDASAEVAKVRIGLDSFGGAVVVYVAQQQGFFQAHAIEATIDTYSVGVDTLNAVLAGSADFGMAFDYGSLGAMVANQLRYVATVTRTEPGFHQLALSERVASPEDLAGKRMGIVAGTQQHFITLKHLEKLGIAPDDVELLSFGAVLEIVAALRTGQLDAAWVFGQGVGEIAKIPGATIVADDGEVLPAGIGLLISSRQLVEQRPEVVERVLAALVDAREWLETDPGNLEIAAAFIASELKAPVDGVFANIEPSEQTVSFTVQDLALLQEMAEFRTQLSPEQPLEIEQYLALEPLREVAPDAVQVP